MRKNKKDWFKLKKYPHIGRPISIKDKKRVMSYILSPENIAKHSFLPFIHKTSLVRKFRKEYNEEGNPIKAEGTNKIQRVKGQKKRELFYASHLDSLIFSYYSYQLSDKYEKLIKEYKLDEVVCAYRSIPIDENNPNSTNKSNIEIANDAFDLIKKYPKDFFCVIAFDITSFFDNLDHRILREKWEQVLSVDKLPIDHFNIYKNITRFIYLYLVYIFSFFKGSILTQKITTREIQQPVKRKKISRIKFLRNQNAIAFCEKKEFLKVKHKLVHSFKNIKKGDQLIPRTFGIPQGSPISATLANIYLVDFDKDINSYIQKIGGHYKRYSDDIIIVCTYEYRKEICHFVMEEITKYKLEIQEAKTQVFEFKRENNKLTCAQIFKDTINRNKNLIYLGFEFDGESIKLKNSSLSGYYRKMKRYIRRAKFYSYKYQEPIFRRRILKKFSYKGAKRNRKVVWNEAEKRLYKYDTYNYGNYITYAKKAISRMPNNRISNQIKKHWKNINKLLKDCHKPILKKVLH